MGLIGHEIEVGEQTQRVADLIYEEIIDELLMEDPDDDVDIAVAIKLGPLVHKATGEPVDDDEIDTIDDDDVTVAGVTIIDYQVVRIGAKVVAYGLDEDAGMTETLFAIDDWARSVRGANAYIFVHHHAEGNPRPSKKDLFVINALAAIDYGRSTDRQRLLVAALILNRDDQRIVAPPTMPTPTMISAIDGPMMARQVELLKEALGVGEDDEFIMLLRQIDEMVLASIRAREDGDNRRAASYMLQAIPLLARLVKMAEERDIDPASRLPIKRKQQKQPSRNDVLNLPKYDGTPQQHLNN